MDRTILVETTNAFNYNRKSMLYNIAFKCPEIDRCKTAMERHLSSSIVDRKRNGEKCTLYSEKGTALRNTTAMVMYALGLSVSVLQSELKHGKNICKESCICR